MQRILALTWGAFPRSRAHAVLPYDGIWRPSSGRRNPSVCAGIRAALLLFAALLAGPAPRAGAADVPDACQLLRSGDAAGALAALADPYHKGTLDVWSARLYQDLRMEAGDRAALLTETQAAFPEPRIPLGQFLMARLADRKEIDAALQRALLVAPETLPVLLDQGFTALASDHLPYAVGLLVKVRKLGAGREEAALLEAAVLDASGDRTEAEHALAAYAAQHPDAVEVRSAWARLLLDANRGGEGAQVLDEALMRGRVPGLLVARAAVAVGLDDFEKAKKLLDEAKEAGRPALRAEALALRSAILLAARDDAAAAEAAAAALKIAPASVPALRAQARSLEVAGKSSEALARIEAAIDLAPTRACLRVDKGAILLRSHRPKEARKALGEARKRDPQNLDASLLLGVLAEGEGDWIAAEKAYRAILKTNPDHVGAHRVLAGVLLGLAKLEQADAEAGWIIDRYPKDAAAWFVRGRVALRQDKYDDALSAFQKATDAEPTYALGHTGRGWTYEAQDKKEDAKKAYEAAIKADPALPLPRRYLGALLEDMDDAPGALASYKAYLELGGDDPDQDIKHSVERLVK